MVRISIDRRSYMKLVVLEDKNGRNSVSMLPMIISVGQMKDIGPISRCVLVNSHLKGDIVLFPNRRKCCQKFILFNLYFSWMGKASNGSKPGRNNFHILSCRSRPRRKLQSAAPSTIILFLNITNKNRTQSLWIEFLDPVKISNSSRFISISRNSKFVNFSRRCLELAVLEIDR